MTDLLSSIFNIRKSELKFSLWMFLYFFLVITNFWILKPLKKAAFFNYYTDGLEVFGTQFKASQLELWAKCANLVVAAIAVVAFTMISRRYAREQLTMIFSFFFACFYILFALTMDNPGGAGVWAFYLFGDLFSTLMVASFFVFLNDSVSQDGAKRLYGLVGLGGVLGGAFGSLVVRSLVKEDTMTSAIWMIICFLLQAGILLCAFMASKGKSLPTGYDLKFPQKVEEPSRDNAVIAGAKLVFNSKYLFSIVAIVGLYEIVSTLVDFQFSSTVEYFAKKDNLNIGGLFADAYFYMNIVAVIVQLFLTSFVMQKFGVRIALFVLPMAILFVSIGYLAFPVLMFAMMMPSADGGFAYSMNQSAKESLYVPATKEEKYGAKAFIDMFVQRGAKVLAIIVSLVITKIFEDFSTIRWLSLITVVMVVLWFVAASYAGKKFKEAESKASEAPQT